MAELANKTQNLDKKVQTLIEEMNDPAKEMVRLWYMMKIFDWKLVKNYIDMSNTQYSYRIASIVTPMIK